MKIKINICDMKNIAIQEDINLRVQLYADAGQMFLRVWQQANRKGKWCDYIMHGATIPTVAAMSMNEQELLKVRSLAKTYHKPSTKAA